MPRVQSSSGKINCREAFSKSGKVVNVADFVHNVGDDTGVRGAIRKFGKMQTGGLMLVKLAGETGKYSLIDSKQAETVDYDAVYYSGLADNSRGDQGAEKKFFLNNPKRKTPKPKPKSKPIENKPVV